MFRLFVYFCGAALICCVQGFTDAGASKVKLLQKFNNKKRTDDQQQADEKIVRESKGEEDLLQLYRELKKDVTEKIMSDIENKRSDFPSSFFGQNWWNQHEENKQRKKSDDDNETTNAGDKSRSDGVVDMILSDLAVAGDKRSALVPPTINFGRNWLKQKKRAAEDVDSIDEILSELTVDKRSALSPHFGNFWWKQQEKGKQNKRSALFPHFGINVGRENKQQQKKSSTDKTVDEILSDVLSVHKRSSTLPLIRNWWNKEQQQQKRAKENKGTAKNEDEENLKSEVFSADKRSAFIPLIRNWWNKEQQQQKRAKENKSTAKMGDKENPKEVAPIFLHRRDILEALMKQLKQ